MAGHVTVQNWTFCVYLVEHECSPVRLLLSVDCEVSDSTPASRCFTQKPESDASSLTEVISKQIAVSQLSMKPHRQQRGGAERTRNPIHTAEMRVMPSLCF